MAPFASVQSRAATLQEQIAARAAATTGVEIDVSQREIDMNKSLLRLMAGEE